MLCQHLHFLGLYISPISLGASRWLQGTIFRVCFATTLGQLPVFPGHCWNIQLKTEPRAGAFFLSHSLSPSLQKLQITDDEYLAVLRLLSPRTTWSVSTHDNRLPFCDSSHALLPLGLVITQQVLTGTRDWGHFVVECCNKTTLSHDYSRDLTACFLRKYQPLLQSFQNPLRIYIYIYIYIYIFIYLFIYLHTYTYAYTEWAKSPFAPVGNWALHCAGSCKFDPLSTTNTCSNR